MSDVKTCSRCREAKPLDAFSYRAARADKRQAMCRPCAAEKVSEWRRQNPEQTRKQTRRRRERVQDSTPEPFTRADVLAEWERLGIDPGTCYYCGAADGSTIDHFWPISAEAGYNTPANLRPCCRYCQTSKGASGPLEWIERTGQWPHCMGRAAPRFVADPRPDHARTRQRPEVVPRGGPRTPPGRPPDARLTALNSPARPSQGSGLWGARCPY